MCEIISAIILEMDKRAIRAINDMAETFAIMAILINAML